MSQQHYCAICQCDQVVFGRRCIVCGSELMGLPQQPEATGWRTHPLLQWTQHPKAWLFPLVPAWIMAMVIAMAEVTGMEVSVVTAKSGGKAQQLNVLVLPFIYLVLSHIVYIGAHWGASAAHTVGLKLQCRFAQVAAVLWLYWTTTPFFFYCLTRL